jgi:hypothetical protein
MAGPLIAASREVLNHHHAQHRCERGWPPRPGEALVCVCRTTAILLCERCFAPMYLAARPSQLPCRHTREPLTLSQWSAVPTDWLLSLGD